MMLGGMPADKEHVMHVIPIFFFFFQQTANLRSCSLWGLDKEHNKSSLC